MQSSDLSVTTPVTQQSDGTEADCHAKEKVLQEWGETVHKTDRVSTLDEACLLLLTAGTSMNSRDRGLSPLIREGRLVLQRPMSASPSARSLQSSYPASTQPQSLTPSGTSPALTVAESLGPQILSQSAPNLLQNLSVSSVVGEATCPGCGTRFEVSLSESEPNSPLLDPNRLNFDFQTPSDTPVVDPKVQQEAVWRSSPRRLVAKTVQGDMPVTCSSTPATGRASGLEHMPERWTSTSLHEKFKQHISPLKVILKSTPAPGQSLKGAAAPEEQEEPSASLEPEQGRAGDGRGELGHSKLPSSSSAGDTLVPPAAQSWHQVQLNAPHLQTTKPSGERGPDELDHQYASRKDERDGFGDGGPTEEPTPGTEKPEADVDLDSDDLQSGGARSKDQMSGWEEQEDDAISQGFVPVPDSEAGWEEQNYSEDVRDEEQEQPPGPMHKTTEETEDQPLSLEEELKVLRETLEDQAQEDHWDLDQREQLENFEDGKEEGWSPAEPDQVSPDRDWRTPPMAAKAGGAAASGAPTSDDGWISDGDFQPQGNTLQLSPTDWSDKGMGEGEEHQSVDQTQEPETAAQGETTWKSGLYTMESYDEFDSDTRKENYEESEQSGEELQERGDEEFPGDPNQEPEAESPQEWGWRLEKEDDFVEEEGPQPEESNEETRSDDLEPQADDQTQEEGHARARWEETWLEPYFIKLAEQALEDLGEDDQETRDEPQGEVQIEQVVQEDEEGRKIQKTCPGSPFSEGKATMNQHASSAGNLQESGSSQNDLQTWDDSAGERGSSGLQDKASPSLEMTSPPWTNLSGGDVASSDSETLEPSSLAQHLELEVPSSEMTECGQMKRKQLASQKNDPAKILKHTHCFTQHSHSPSAQGKDECSFCKNVVVAGEVLQEGESQPLSQEVEEVLLEESDNEVSETESISDAETVLENLSPRPLSRKGLHGSLKLGAVVLRKLSPAVSQRDSGTAGDVGAEEETGKRDTGTEEETGKRDGDAKVPGQKTPVKGKGQKLLSCRDILLCIATRGRPRDPWPCLLCDVECASALKWQEHIRSCHAADEATARKDFEWRVVFEALREMHLAKVGIQRCYLCNKFWEPRSSAVLSHILLSHLAPLAPDLRSKILGMFQEGSGVDVPLFASQEQYCRYCLFISPSIFHAAEHFKRSHFVHCFEQMYLSAKDGM